MFSRISVFLGAPKWLDKREPMGGSSKDSSKVKLVEQKGDVVTTRAIRVVE